MKKTLLAVATAAALSGASGVALAADIGGLNVPTGANFAVGQVYENVVTQVGDVLQGYGKVDSINSFAVGALCANCELTYRFTGFTVTSILPNEVKFTGGTISFYLGFGAANNFNTSNAGGSAGDLAEATDGTLFLTLKGHAIDAAGNTFVGPGANIGTTSPTGFGTGLADVDMAGGGIANSFFNTNGVLAAFGGGNADFELGSSFSGLNPVYPAECPGGAACVRGSADFTGNVAAIPEPGTYALMFAGLGVVGLVARRRRQQR
jgi:hypothetical protein